MCLNDDIRCIHCFSSMCFTSSQMKVRKYAYFISTRLKLEIPEAWVAKWSDFSYRSNEMFGNKTEMALMLNLAACSNASLGTYGSLAIYFCLLIWWAQSAEVCFYCLHVQVLGGGGRGDRRISKVTFPNCSFNTPNFLEDKLPSAGATESLHAGNDFLMVESSTVTYLK